MLRTGYARSMHTLRASLERGGLLARLERRPGALSHHVRTLFAIHDAVDLARLGHPWWTYTATRHVDRFLRTREAHVFEWGSGASTVWLASRAKSVVSVEHDEAFAAVVEPMLRAHRNARLLRVPCDLSSIPVVPSRRRGYSGYDFRRYRDSIIDIGDTYDLIVIDGRARLATLERAASLLKPDGLIVFDDILRPRYRAAMHLPGYACYVTFGAKPCLPYPSSTGLLRRLR